MNERTAKFFNWIKKDEVQHSIELAATTSSIPAPEAGIVIEGFKKAANWADQIMLNHILKGLASGFNQEQCTNELFNYVDANPENAGHVANTLRKALLAESPIACTLLGRILADHIRDKTSYDRSDIIITHALETTTDDDIKSFRQMMSDFNGEEITITDYESADWCLANRLFVQNFGDTGRGSTMMSPRIVPAEAAKKLMVYIEEIKPLFREKLL